MNMLLRRRAITSGNIIVTSTGKNPVFIENAKAGKLKYVSFDGASFQFGKPSPEKPFPIKSLGKDVSIVSTAVSGSVINHNCSFNEPLRKVYKVADTADSRGIIVRRCAEKVFDGSENWKINTVLESVNRFYIPLEGAMNVVSSAEKNTVVCSHFGSSCTLSQANAKKSVGVAFHFGKELWVYTDSNKFPSLDSFKNWLHTNPMTVVYALAQEKEEKTELCDVFIPDGDSFISVYTGDVSSDNIKVRYRKK